jgi:hypothetical protein
MTRNMKSSIFPRLILYGMLLMGGAMLGAITQRYVGIGNILRAVGIPYPTAVVPAPATVQVAEIAQAYQGQMRLFILAGQSNMVGWAPIPEGEPTDPRIYVFGKDYRWRLANHPIEDAANQVDMVSENLIAGFGPAMDFAFASLERHPDIVIGLIPCARNSSGIIQWQRDLSDQSLYGSCLKRVRAASPIGEISGILFFQGETDAADPIQYPDPPPHPSDWSELFTAFVTDFRNDLRQPDLPVVFAQLGSTWAPEAFPNWEAVKAQQASLRLSRSAMIITDDLPLLDGLHFTTDSYRLIGRRFADAYWELVEQNFK